jgi:hypothetical protein
MSPGFAGLGKTLEIERWLVLTGSKVDWFSHPDQRMREPMLMHRSFMKPPV